MNIGIVFGDQLWKNNPLIGKVDRILMVEDYEFAAKLPYHRFKLTYLYTAMRRYRDYLRDQGITVSYTTLNQQTSLTQVLSDTDAGDTIHMITPHDKSFAKYLEGALAERNLEHYESPGFLTQRHEFEQYLENKTQKRLLMADFYEFQRTRLDVLIDEGKPVGGSWSFDSYNREKLPKDIQIPERTGSYSDPIWQSAKQDVMKYFGENPGQVNDSWLPTCHDDAEDYLDHFLESFLFDFGTYEDAMTTRSDMVYHSGISALLNYGLLTPENVITKTLEHAPDWDLRKPDHKRLLYSMEGFVRQVIGWREWIKGMYDTQYTKEVVDMNFFDARRVLPDFFWSLSESGDGNLPLNLVMDKINRTAYAHHIERLMILANWMTLNEYEPKECYNWFRCMFIDGLEWVMVPNVYGMGLFADGGVFATKPYVASSNYIKKMSDYPKGDWQEVWTKKFWDFLLKHEDYFKSNPRMNMLIKQRKKRQ